MDTIIIREVKAKYGEEKEIAVEIVSPICAYKFFEFLRNEIQEHVYILSLDNRSKPLAYSRIATGSGNLTFISARDVFRNALLSNAFSIMLAHNHPSNSLKFSFEDYAVTKKLVDAGRVVGVEVIDHILITCPGYLSMREECIIDF
jgi:DNA repair protein RadC